MPRNFDWLNFKSGGARGSAFWLQATITGFAVLNLLAAYFYFMPPGGSRHYLMEEEARLHREIQVRHAAATRLKMISHKVELGGDETQQFADRYFLPRRTAFESLFSELLRMSAAAGLRERERTYTLDPIEGTDDLTLLTINSNYQGTYSDLMKFLAQVDKSSQLLILDSLNATPQQQGSGTLTVALRFLAVVREEGSSLPGVASENLQPAATPAAPPDATAGVRQ